MEARDLKLMRLHDGELPAAEAERLRAELSAEEKDKLGALDELDGVLHGALLKDAEGVDLWAGLAARLPLAEVQPETKIEAKPETKPEAQPEARPAATITALPLRRRRGVQATAIMTMLAMAAGFMLWVMPGGPVQNNRCEVERLEVAGNAATVLQVPGDQGDATTVVWMEHQESDEWESL